MINDMIEINMDKLNEQNESELIYPESEIEQINQHDTEINDKSTSTHQFLNTSCEPNLSPKEEEISSKY